MHGLFSKRFNQLVQTLEPDQILSLSLADMADYRCQRGGTCCRQPWKVDVGPDYYQQWHVTLQSLANTAEPVLRPYTHSQAAQGAYAYLVKRPGTQQCLFQADDHSCRIHSTLGEAALPPICRSFPRERLETGQYQYSSLASACQHAAALLDQQARLRFQILPAAPSLPVQSLNISQQRQLSAIELLPWLGWMLDRIFDSAQSVQTGLGQSIQLLQIAEQRPEATLAELLEGFSPRPDQRLNPSQALELFLACSPYGDKLENFLQASLSQGQFRLRLPLSAVQRQQRFYRHYLLRRLLNLELLSQWQMSLSQAIWLLSYGLLAQQFLLCYRALTLASPDPANLSELVWALNQWEIHGMQNPLWLQELGLLDWNDTDCLRGAGQAASFAFSSASGPA